MLSQGPYCLGESKIDHKFVGLCVGKLEPVVWHNYIKDAMDSEDAFQFRNPFATDLVVKVVYHCSSIMIVYHQDLGFAMKFRFRPSLDQGHSWKEEKSKDFVCMG